MAGFTEVRWQQIMAKLNQNPMRFGLPVRRSGSVVIGSFNALKLGKATPSAKRWDFLVRFASRFDLLAVQEVMDDLSGIRRLHASLGSKYALIVSDTTGAAPGDSGLRERLAYLYRPDRVDLKELVSDITYDRSVVTNALREDIDTWKAFFQQIDDDNALRKQQGKKPKSLSKYAHPAFLTFIRNPHCAAFAIKGKNGAQPIEFLAVNAHTLFGNSEEERTREFNALIDWLVKRAKSRDRMYFKNMVLMADLNMQFDNAGNKYSDIVKRLIDLQSNLLSGQTAARVNFPFLDVHPDHTGLFNTNARSTETFDHVALFIDQHETALPLTQTNTTAGNGGPNGYDYGVFNFTELFAQVLHDKPFDALTKSQRNSLLKNAKADVSDHMPTWVRLPIPGAS